MPGSSVCGRNMGVEDAHHAFEHALTPSYYIYDSLTHYARPLFFHFEGRHTVQFVFKNCMNYFNVSN